MRELPQMMDDPKTMNRMTFELQTFFPYLVRVFYSEVTSAISKTYAKDFDMSPTEWRSMAILGPNQSLTANAIAEMSSMDKVTVSRAVSKMKKREWIMFSVHENDRRSKLISLTPNGQETYYNIVPRVLEVEARLLEGINQSQRDHFLLTMRQIIDNKKKLINEE